ncbi:hypothetical protein ACJW8B_10605 [Plesiomonas shigelloides]|uniref:hypothetical protein n=1 Tax=Plesiomonas shigelloides TaxID=703 RepID=UPI00387F1B12
MGYKYKATMYYSDEETAQFLSEHARKRNGKKSASHYLYSLVTKERENAIPMRNKSNTPQSNIHPEYIPFTELPITGEITFTSLANKDAAKKTERKKQLSKWVMDEIDNEIKQKITNNIIGSKNTFLCKSVFLVIKTQISIDYYFDNLDPEYCKGTFTATALVIRLSPNEYGEFSSHLDFENIDYYKYEDILKLNRTIPSDICKIAERHPTDPIGAFFITVMKAPKQFSANFESGKVIIVPFDIYKDGHRIKMKLSKKCKKFNYRGCSYK